jgi:threonine/homoserine/homoserine lactone efflux protein
MRGRARPIDAADGAHQENAFPARAARPQSRGAMPLDPALFLAFLAAAWVLILMPGPDTVFVLGQTLAGGPRRGWAAVRGIVTGALVHVAAAAAGVAALVAASPPLFAALQAVGAAYLLWLGAGALRSAWRGGGGGGGGPAHGPPPDAPAGDAFVQGMLTNLLNPKVALFFLAFLPQFVDPDRSPAWVQMLLLGPLVPLMAVPFFGLVILGASRAKARLGRIGAGASRWVEGAAGALFVALGLRLVVQVATASR